MKKVFSNAEVCHVFAQRMQSEGRNSTNSLYFEKDIIYSYGKHFPLAWFTKKGNVVINSKCYSITTTQHQSIIRSATRQYKQFDLEDTQIETVYNNCLANYESYKKARHHRAYHLQQIVDTFNRFKEYINLEETKEDIEKIKEFKEYQEISVLVNKILNSSLLDDAKRLDDISKQKSKENAEIRQAKKRELEKLSFEEKLQKFFDHKISYVNVYGHKDYLRISKDKTKVETTQGVKVDIKEAKLLYSLIKSGRDIKGYKIDRYTVISLNGVLQIGCHKIDTDNMREVGEQILSMQ